MSPWHLVVVAIAGWMNREQQAVIDYLTEENRVLREQLGPGCPRLTDSQRRRLAAKGRALGRKALQELGCLVTPDTILRWYRQLIAKKYDGLPRYYVFFVHDLASRRVELGGIVHQPHGPWMAQVARSNLTDVEDGFLARTRFLIVDRDSLDTLQFRDLLASAGVKAVRLPPRSPNLNAYAERFVLSIKSEPQNTVGRCNSYNSGNGM